MVKKLRCEKCTSGWCKNHVFELTPEDSRTYFRRKIKFRLCPKLSKTTNTFESIIPLINIDSKHYTPCFILEEEKNYYSTNDHKLLAHHEEKIDLENSQENTIMVAKHGHKKNYCSVCKQNYNDYLEHVEQFSHKKILRSNRFTSYITELETSHTAPKLIIPKEIPYQESTEFTEGEKTRQINR